MTTNWSDVGNWVGGAPPANDGTADIIINQSIHASTIDGVWSVKTLTGVPASDVNFTGAAGSSLRVIGAVTGGFQLVKAGDLAVIMSNGSGINVLSASQGTLESVGGGGIGGTVTVDGSASLGLSGGGTIYNASLLLGSMGNGSQAGLYSLSGYNTYQGPITLSGDASMGAAAGASLSIYSGFSPGQGMITGTGDLHFAGAGTVYMSKQLRHQGNVLVDSGIAQVGNNGLYGGNYVVRSGGTLQSYATNLTNGNGGVTVEDGGTLSILGGKLNEAITLTGNGVNGQGALRIGNSSNITSSLGPVILVGNTRVGLFGYNSNTNSNANQFTNIGGSGNLEFVGSGGVNILPGSTYEGTTTINMTSGGYVRVADLAVFGANSTPIMVKGGALDLRDIDFNGSFYQEEVIISGDRAIHLNGGTISGSKFNLAADVVLLADATISGENSVLSGSITGDGKRLTLNGTGYPAGLDLQGMVDLGSGGITVASSYLVVFSSTMISYTGATIVQGVLREGAVGALPATSNLQLAGATTENGGILELALGDFTGAVGPGPGAVSWAGSGGFAAVGADRMVNLGGSAATMVWGATSGFLSDGQSLKLGATNSTKRIELLNGLDLNGQTRTGSYSSGVTGEAAELSGDISNGILRVERRGSYGYLRLSGSNSFSGLEVRAPVLAEANALPASANINFAGDNSSVLLLAGNYSGGLGTGAGQVQWTGSGGFAAFGQDVIVNLAPTSLTWASGGFVPTGQSLVLGSESTNHKLTFADNIALGAVDRTVFVNHGTGSGIDAALTGIVSGIGGLIKNGSGSLIVSGANTFTGNLSVQNGVLETNSMGGDTGTAGPLGKGKVILSYGTFRYTGLSNGPSNRFGSGSLAGNATLEITTPATDLVLDAGFTSTASWYRLTKRGLGAITLSAGSSNTNLNVWVEEGRVDLAKTGSAYAVQDLQIKGGSVRLDGTSTNQINGGLIMSGTGQFFLNGRNETVSYFNGNSPNAVVQNGSSTASRLTINSESAYSYYSGKLINGGSGSLGLTKTGTGRLVLSGTNTHSGSTMISGGELAFLSPSSLSSNSNVSLGDFATLSLGFDWAPTLGTGAGQLKWNTNAFYAGLSAAVSGGASLSIGGVANPTTLKFGATNFVLDDYGLIFGSQYAAGTLNLRNPLNLNGKAQLIGMYNHSDVLIEGELSGVLSNGTGLNIESIGGNQTLFPSPYRSDFDIGRIKLSGNNTFDGPVTIDRAGVVIDRIGNVGSGAGPLGLASTAAKGAIVLESYGELRYTGTGHSTDRQIYMGRDGYSSSINAIIAEGSGALVWNGDITNLYSNTAQTLYLSGPSTAANEIAGDILPFQASTDTILLRKYGAGTWVLSGNTNTGSMSVQGGLLELRGNHHLANSLSTFNDTTVRIGGAITTGPSFYDLMVNNDARLQFTGGFGFSGSINYYQDGATPGIERFVVLDGASVLSGKTTIINSGTHRFTTAAGASLTFDTPGGGNAIETTQPGLSVAFGGEGDFVVNDAISLTGGSTFTFDGVGTLILNASNTFAAAYLTHGETFANHNEAFGANNVTVSNDAVLHVNAATRLAAGVHLEDGGTFLQALASGADLSGLGAQLEVTAGSATNARIRAGEMIDLGDVSFAMNLDSGIAEEGLRAILSLTGTGDAVFALSMQTETILDDESHLGWRSGGSWVNAVSGNVGNGSLAGGYFMSWDQFVSDHSGNILSDMLGAYGVDTGTGEVWAVINHNSDFNIVPEPSTALLIMLGVLPILRRMRNRRA